ncbi:helix-turn-helix domain-containing protein [Bdellovibrionota bacterium FG-1]
MEELIEKELNQTYPDKAFLTIQEVAELMRCSPEIVYNWTKRADAARRPPKLSVGKEIRFPKVPFAHWLAQETGVSRE